MRYFIVEDDAASRTMLKRIIHESNLGFVVGEASSGVEGIPLILSIQPDIVLVDLLMPQLDGIETMEQLKEKGYRGHFIMISQVVNKEMVGEAYEKGVDFYIHKPINRVEVETILKKVEEQIRIKNSLLTIQQSLNHVQLSEGVKKKMSIREVVLFKLNEMGIIGEGGTDAIVTMIEILFEKGNSTSFPPLRDLYEETARRLNATDIAKEVKSIEQRIRRTLLAGAKNIAYLGAIDYTNPKFEHYGTSYFDFHEIRKMMVSIQEGDEEPEKIKINIKKFIHALYLEVMEKYMKYE